MTFRIYYKGSEPDPLFPKPEIRDFAILSQGTTGSFPPPGGTMENAATMAAAAPNHAMHNNKVGAAAAPNVLVPNDMSSTTAASGGVRKSQLIMAELSVANNNNNFSSSNNGPMDQRRKVLSEVREHLDLLKEFEGVISDEELAERKRQLFLALPPAPPPAGTSASKRARNM